jgi:hypothetical protein
MIFIGSYPFLSVSKIDASGLFGLGDEGATMKTLKATLMILAAGILLGIGLPVDRSGVQGVFQTASAEEAWKTEFDSICSRTQDSMTIDIAELRSLVTRSDNLKKSIEQLDETRRKVYLKRLQMCRDLYAFMIETKLEAAKEKK